MNICCAITYFCNPLCEKNSIVMYSILLMLIAMQGCTKSGSSEEISGVNYNQGEVVLLSSLQMSPEQVQLPQSLSDRFLEDLNAAKIEIDDIEKVSASVKYTLLIRDDTFAMIGGVDTHHIFQNLGDQKARYYENERFSSFNQIIFQIIKEDGNIDAKSVQSNIDTYLE